MLIRNHTEQEDVIRTTLDEPRGKSPYRVEGTDERMHSNRTYSCQLRPHSIHTWAGYRHSHNENVWQNAERMDAGGRLSPIKRG